MVAAGCYICGGLLLSTIEEFELYHSRSPSSSFISLLSTIEEFEPKDGRTEFGVLQELLSTIEEFEPP